MIEELIILTNIIFITIILTADNAVIVGSIASNFVPKNRKQIILWGVIGAFVFKIFFAVFATFLFEFYFIKILGGLLLIWIVNDLRKDLLDIKKIKSTTKKGKATLINLIGYDDSLKYCDKIIKEINKNLRKYGSRSEKINETLGYILNRKK